MLTADLQVQDADRQLQSSSFRFPIFTASTDFQHSNNGQASGPSACDESPQKYISVHFVSA
jgi:hypothetical protein